MLFLLATIDECLDDYLPCVRGGTCDDINGSPVCTCPFRLTGSFCEGKQKASHAMISCLTNYGHFLYTGEYIQVCQWSASIVEQSITYFIFS